LFNIIPTTSSVRIVRINYHIFKTLSVLEYEALLWFCP